MSPLPQLLCGQSPGSGRPPERDDREGLDALTHPARQGDCVCVEHRGPTAGLAHRRRINSLANPGTPVAAGLVGSILGVDAYVDPNLPTNFGAGTNQDAVLMFVGSLTDEAAEPGERVATMDLFAGAIGTYKNPSSHRQVDYSDPTEAVVVVFLADLLHRILDRTERAANPATASGP